MKKLYISSKLEKYLANTENKNSESKTKSNKIINENKKIDKYFSQQWIRKYLSK